MNNELIKRWERNVGVEEVKKLLNLQISNDKYIRVNLSKISVDKVCQFLKKNRVKFSKTFLPNAIKIEKSFFNLSSSLLSLNGEIYLQDLASQIPINLIDFNSLKKLNRKINILDMAGSPGSKTTQLCDLLNFNKINYKLIALEPEIKRLQKLVNNLQRQNCKNVCIINSLGENFKSKIKFDLILLDAPCSGNLIGDSNWLKKRDVKGIFERAKIQKNLLKNASNLLDDNGVLIYSTCSLEIEENEENIIYAKNNLDLISYLPNFKFPFCVKPLKSQNSFRFMPTKSNTQGFFISYMRKYN